MFFRIAGGKTRNGDGTIPQRHPGIRHAGLEGIHRRPPLQNQQPGSDRGAPAAAETGGKLGHLAGSRSGGCEAPEEAGGSGGATNAQDGGGGVCDVERVGGLEGGVAGGRAEVSAAHLSKVSTTTLAGAAPP